MTDFKFVRVVRVIIVIITNPDQIGQVDDLSGTG